MKSLDFGSLRSQNNNLYHKILKQKEQKKFNTKHI